MRNIQKHKKMDSLLVLILMGIFSICILLVLLTGADAYQRLAQRDQRSYDCRTAQQYLTTRVRQADCQGGITIEQFGGTCALAVHEQIDNEDYQTLIYCYDGYLRELFVQTDGDFSPADGEKVLQAQSLSVRWQDRLLVVELTDPSGQTQPVILSLRSGEGAAS